MEQREYERKLALRAGLRALVDRESEAFTAWNNTCGESMEVFKAAEYRLDVLSGWKRALARQFYS